MKMNNSLKAVLLMSFIMSLSCRVQGSAESKKVDPLVGTWVFNQMTEEKAVYGVGVFNADGTFIIHDSGDLTQSLPGLAASGALITVSAGCWKRITKGIYELVSTNVVLLRGLNCTNFTPVDLSSPACPVARLKVVSDFIFDEGCKSGASSRITTFHPIDDLTLSLPIPPPQGPIMPLPSYRIWQKLCS